MFRDTFRSDADYVSLEFQGLMDGSQDNRARIATVGAAAMLLLHLPTPRNYSSLLNEMINILGGAIYDRDLVCDALDAMGLLARGKPGLLSDQFTSLAKSAIRILTDTNSNQKMKRLGIDLFVKVSDSGLHSYGMIQNLPDDLIEELLAQLLQMLMCIEDDTSWNEADVCVMDAGKMNKCSYAENALRKLARVLGVDALVSNYPKLHAHFFADFDWQKRYAAVTALRLIIPFFRSSRTLVEHHLKYCLTKTAELIRDQHPRVCWTAIHAVCEFSSNLSPYFQAKYEEEVISALSVAMAESANPIVQIYATSAMSLFCKKSVSNVLKRHLETIINKLLRFLEIGNTFFKETALSELASLADSAKLDFQPFYARVMPCLKLILDENSNSMLVAKTIECITVVGVAVGTSVFSTDVEEAWGRICKSLGENFHPYINIAVPLLIKSAELKADPMEINWGVEEIRFVWKKTFWACNAITNIYAKGLHLWIEEVLTVVRPLLTFQFNEEVRVAAISVMPLLLRSAATAVENELPIPGFLDSPIITLAKIIMPALVEVLEAPAIKVQVQGLLALSESIQIGTTWAPDNDEIIGSILMVLSECFERKKERENLEKYSLDFTEPEQVKEEIQEEQNVCREVRICLPILFKRLCAQNIIPEIVYVKIMWQKDTTPEERRMAFDIFRYIDVEFGEQGLSQFAECIPFMFEACRDTDPDIQQIAARAIGIYVEFDRETFRQHLEDGVSSLEFILEHANEHTAKGAAICAYGKVCFFLCCEEMNLYENIDRWLVHLPIRHWTDEAKVAHKLLCSIVDKLNTRDDDHYITQIIPIIVELLWIGKRISEEETLDRMIQQLNMFKQSLDARRFRAIQNSLPRFLQDTLQRHT